MPPEAPLRFGAYQLAGPRGPLVRDAQVVPLPPKALAVLWLLASQAGQVVTKTALLDAVWADTAVNEGVLTVCLRTLRQALTEDAKQPRYIATVHRLGYRFVAPVTLGTSTSLARTPSALAALPPPSTPAPRPLPVGREAEVARLHACLAQARQGGRQTVFITGEGGVGKTTVVDAFLHQIAPTEALWLGRGQCIEHYGAGEAYLPVLEALGRLGREPGGERLVACLRQYAPTWLGQMPVLLPPEALAAVQRQGQGVTRERMLRELAEALEILAAERPVVLVLEDLHWSDPSTVEALALLARRRDPARLLVLGTYRPVELILHDHPLKMVKQELAAYGQCVDIPLGGLGRPAVAAYVAQRGVAPEGSAGVAAFVYRRTEGHPLFMVQMVDYLEQQEVFHPYDQTASGRAVGAAMDQDVPQGLQQLIEAQVGRLRAEEQQVLEAGSVAGAEFAITSVATGLQAAPEAIEAVCERLARRGQFIEDRGLVEWPDGTVSGCYGFRHALYQEVVYTRIGASRRTRVHRRVGERVEQAYGARAHEVAAELAMHFERGRDYQRAVQYLGQAADNALQRYAYQEAVGHLTRGLELLTTFPPAPARTQQELEFQMALGLALMALKGYGAPEVANAYTRARELCQQGEDTSQLFPVLWGLYAFYLVRAELKTAWELGEQCLALAQRAENAALRMEAHRALGSTLLFRGEFTLARAHLEQASALYDPQQHRSHAFVYAGDPEVVCLSYLAWTLWFLGYPDQALQSSHKALTLAQELPHPYSMGFALNWAVRLHHYRHEGQRALERADACVTLCTEQGFAYLSAMGTVSRGWARTWQRQGEEGMRQIDQGLAVFRATGAVLHQVYFLALLAEGYKSAGQIQAGLDVLAEALVVVDHTEERWYEAELYRLTGELWLAVSEEHHTEVTACFQQALALARRQQAKSLELRAAMSLARLWQQQGKHVEARELLAPVYGWFTEGFDTVDLLEAKTLLEELS